MKSETLDIKSIENKAKDLVSQMSLDEKIAMTAGRDPWSTVPLERLNIPWIWMSDGPHGLRRAPDTSKMGYGDQLEATCFPTASAWLPAGILNCWKNRKCSGR